MTRLSPWRWLTADWAKGLKESLIRTMILLFYYVGTVVSVTWSHLSLGHQCPLAYASQAVHLPLLSCSSPAQA